MSAFTSFISLISEFFTFLLTGLQSIFDFGRISLSYLQIFTSFLPPQFVALFMIVIFASLIYLIVGR